MRYFPQNLKFDFNGRTVNLRNDLSKYAGTLEVLRDVKNPPADATYPFHEADSTSNWSNVFEMKTRQAQEELRLVYTPLSRQWYYGNPELLGKNWPTNKNDLVQCPAHSRILNMDVLTCFGSEWLAQPNRSVDRWWKTTHEGLYNHWMENDIYQTKDKVHEPHLRSVATIVPEGKRLGQEYNKGYTSSRTYDWKTLGAWRGARGNVVFETKDGRDLGVVEYSTTRENTMENKNGIINFYDADVTFWRIDGTKTNYVFQHCHRFHRTDYWHDDYHGGHEVCGAYIGGNGNTVVINFYEDFILEGSLAADTWGSLFKLAGEDNLLILNIYNGAKVKILGKLYPFYNMNVNKNMIIVNVFEGGYFEWNRQNGYQETRENWKTSPYFLNDLRDVGDKRLDHKPVVINKNVDLIVGYKAKEQPVFMTGTTNSSNRLSILGHLKVEGTGRHIRIIFNQQDNIVLPVSDSRDQVKVAPLFNIDATDCTIEFIFASPTTFVALTTAAQQRLQFILAQINGSNKVILRGVGAHPSEGHKNNLKLIGFNSTKFNTSWQKLFSDEAGRRECNLYYVVRTNQDSVVFNEPLNEKEVYNRVEPAVPYPTPVYLPLTGLSEDTSILRMMSGKHDVKETYVTKDVTVTIDRDTVPTTLDYGNIQKTDRRAIYGNIVANGRTINLNFTRHFTAKLDMYNSAEREAQLGALWGIEGNNNIINVNLENGFSFIGDDYSNHHDFVYSMFFIRGTGNTIAIRVRSNKRPTFQNTKLVDNNTLRKFDELLDAVGGTKVSKFSYGVQAAEGNTVALLID